MREDDRGDVVGKGAHVGLDDKPRERRAKQDGAGGAAGLKERPQARDRVAHPGDRGEARGDETQIRAKVLGQAEVALSPAHRAREGDERGRTVARFEGLPGEAIDGVHALPRGGEKPIPQGPEVGRPHAPNIRAGGTATHPPLRPERGRASG